MIEQKKQWLSGVTWDSIVNTNRVQCQAQKVEPRTNPATYATTERAWEQAVARSTPLVEAFDACRRACEQRPFTFNNGNTFAAVARRILDDYLCKAPALEAQILRGTVAHYAAGTIDRRELTLVLGQLARVLSAPVPTPAPSVAMQAEAEAATAAAPAPRAPANLPAPSLAEA